MAGIGLSLFWVYVQFPALLGWNLELNFPAAFIAASAVLAILLCLVGSLGPAVHAARVPVPEALHTE